MRFRSANMGISLLWVAVGLMNTLFAVDRLREHMAGGTGVHFGDVLRTVMWVLIVAAWGYQLLFSRIELLPDALAIRKGFGAKTISYASIVGIRPAMTDSGKRLPRMVELEVAELSPSIYPHTYLRVVATDTQAFAAALHHCVPQAVFEPV